MDAEGRQGREARTTGAAVKRDCFGYSLALTVTLKLSLRLLRSARNDFNTEGLRGRWTRKTLGGEIATVASLRSQRQRETPRRRQERHGRNAGKDTGATHGSNARKKHHAETPGKNAKKDAWKDAEGTIERRSRQIATRGVLRKKQFALVTKKN